MAEIDMIPRSYRDRVRARTLLRVTAALLAAVVVAGAGTGALLRWRTAVTERTLVQREAAVASARDHATRDAARRLQREQREQGDAVLRALRRDGELAGLARALDTALPERVWLTALHLDRDVQQLAPGTPAGGGDLVVTTPAGPQTWHLASTLQLAGAAASLEAVSAFLAQLERQPGIDQLVLAGSSLDAATGVVTFSASATLGKAVRP